MSSSAWEYATLTLGWTRLALPVLLGSSLLATGLVAILSWLLYGVRKQPICLEDDDAEKAETARMQTCPSRDVLLLLLNLLTSTYAAEALVLLLQATFSQKVGCSRMELLASWATLTTYSLATCVLAGDEASDAAGKPYLRVFSTATLVASIAQMGASLTLTYLGESGCVGRACCFADSFAQETMCHRFTSSIYRLARFD